jgi:hypothetical protein
MGDTISTIVRFAIVFLLIVVVIALILADKQDRRILDKRDHHYVSKADEDVRKS